MRFAVLNALGGGGGVVHNLGACDRVVLLPARVVVPDVLKPARNSTAALSEHYATSIAAQQGATTPQPTN